MRTMTNRVLAPPDTEPAPPGTTRHHVLVATRTVGVGSVAMVAFLTAHDSVQQGGQPVGILVLSAIWATVAATLWNLSGWLLAPHHEHAWADDLRDATDRFSSAGLACGTVAFVLFPVVFGPLGLSLGTVGLWRREAKAPKAIAIAGCGWVVGILLRVVVWPIG